MAKHWIAVLLTLLSLCKVGVCETLPGSCRIVCDPSSDQQHRSNGLVIPLASSGAGPPGPAGPPGKAGPPGLPGPSGLGSSKGVVAFSAALQEAFNKNDVLKFGDVITNLGGAYDSSSGTFTCKSAGVYYFIFHILKTGQNLQVDLVLNGKTVVVSAVAVDVLHADTASNSAVLQLKAGDRVYVQLNNSELGKRDLQSRFSTFSGYLLYEI